MIDFTIHAVALFRILRLAVKIIHAKNENREHNVYNIEKRRKLLFGSPSTSALVSDLSIPITVCILAADKTKRTDHVHDNKQKSR